MRRTYGHVGDRGLIARTLGNGLVAQLKGTALCLLAWRRARFGSSGRRSASSTTRSWMPRADPPLPPSTPGGVVVGLDWLPVVAWVLASLGGGTIGSWAEPRGLAEVVATPRVSGDRVRIVVVDRRESAAQRMHHPGAFIGGGEPHRPPATAHSRDWPAATAPGLGRLRGSLRHSPRLGSPIGERRGVICP